MNVGSLSSARRWFIFVWIIAILPHGAAFAEEPTLVEFDIAAQDLGGALTEFGVQSGTEVYFVSADVASVQAPRIEGKYSAIDVIQQLLGSSGVEYFIDGNGTLLVGTAYTAVTTSDERGVSDSKNSRPTPILMAQNRTPQTTSVNRSSNEGSTSIITGKVTDARTGANLKGAKVTIEETGQWTSTNDLGEFRFVNVPTGSATLTVSFLGYAGQSAVVGVDQPRIAQDFALRGGDELEEIIVYGTRTARSLALNQERTAQNVSTIVSSDLLGNFTGNTISDVLRRVPGISFERDPFTGDGTNINIRGLTPDFNQVNLNGVRLPDTFGDGRSADLNNIAADAISQITISKTLLPSQESTGTGGLVEIETASPLDYADGYKRFAVQRTDNGSGFGHDLQASAAISEHFGQSDQFGLYGSIQYREQDISVARYEVSLNYGRLLPLDENGEPTITRSSEIDPRTPFPFDSNDSTAYIRGSGLSFDDNEIETVTANLAGEWSVSDDLTFTARYTHAAREATNFRHRLTLNLGGSYRLRSVPGLGGDMRYALITGTSSRPDATTFSRSESIEYSPNAEDTTDVLSVELDWMKGRWTIDGRIGYAKGEKLIDRLSTGFTFPGAIRFAPSVDVLVPELIDPFIGAAPSAWFPRTGEGFPVPGLNDAGFALLDNNGARTLRSAGVGKRRTSGEDDIFSGNLSVRYDVGSSVLRTVEAGVDYEDSTKKTLSGFIDNGRVLLFDYRPLVFNGTTAEDVGVFGTRAVSLGRVSGNSQQLFISDRSEVLALLNNIDDVAAANPDFLDFVTEELNPLTAGESTTEEDLATYIQFELELGDFGVIGGARVASVEVSATYADGPTVIGIDGSPLDEINNELRQTFSQSDRQTDVLPRVLVNYRPTKNAVLRGGYFVTVARPPIRSLNARRTLFLNLQEVSGPNGDQPSLTVFQGNPGLEPAYTHNYDLSAEYYFDDIGVIKISAFYKEIENFLANTTSVGQETLDGVVFPDHPVFDDIRQNPSRYFITVQQPQNDTAKPWIWGVEFVGEKQFTGLPTPFDGLGVYANYTYTESSRDFRYTWFGPDGAEEIFVDDIPFTGSPKHSGTIGLTYNKYGFDGSLFYSKQARSERGINQANISLSNYVEEIDSLDFRLEYFFDTDFGNYRTFVEATDLLRNSKDAGVQSSVGGENGTPRFYTGGSFFGGRAVTIGVVGTFE